MQEAKLKAIFLPFFRLFVVPFCNLECQLDKFFCVAQVPSLRQLIAMSLTESIECLEADVR